MMALACDEIIMAPDARLGDAGPVTQGPDALFRHATEKVRSDLVRRVRDLSERRGRPPALAEAMVDMDLVVYRVTNRDTGEVTYMSEPEIESSDAPQQWEKGPPVQESREGLFLEVNGTRAAELGLADAVARSRHELAARFGLRADQMLILQTDWVDVSVSILNSWPVTVLLFIVGLIALYVELSAPGIGIGGLIAGLCFALFFWSRFLGGTAGWLEVILFVVGVVFLVVELFVLPGFGFAGVTGILLLLISIVMAGQDFTVPHSGMQLRALLRSVLVVTGSGGASIAAMALLSRYYGTIPILNRLALAPPSGAGPAVAPQDEPGPGPSLYGVRVGDCGVADSPLRPAGRARMGDDYVDVVADSFVEQGRPVRIIKISGNRIVVREMDA
jgi:membrane-bound serine protease (ClpP class)